MPGPGASRHHLCGGSTTGISRQLPFGLIIAPKLKIACRLLPGLSIASSNSEYIKMRHLHNSFALTRARRVA